MLSRQIATFFAVAVLWGPPARAQPVVTAVVNAASRQPGVGRGCLVSILGSNLAGDAGSSTDLPLPKQLADTVVTVGDPEVEAPLTFVSPGQIDAQIPFEVLGSTVPVFVATTEGKSRPFVLTMVDVAPGIFTRSGDGKGPALVRGPDNQPLDVVVPGTAISLYAACLGPTDLPAASGNPGATAEPLNRVINAPEVFVGEFPADVVLARLAPGFAGVYQVDVIPRQIVSDRVVMRSQGRTSNLADIGITPGKNVSNLSGSIQALYPIDDPNSPPNSPFGSNVAYSPLLIAAKFNVRMDILPSAGRFTIAAVSEGASSIITVDPVAASFEGSVTVPTMAARVGDFSGSEFQPIDFLTCHRTGAVSDAVTCFPFPGRILPASRISPFEFMAVSTLPLPDTTIAGSATGTLRVRGTVQAGSTFVIDDANNKDLSAFAGYISIPVPPKPMGTTTLKLFVDGNLVSTSEVVYKVLVF